ncbi:MAG: hypothetical protein CO149_04345 [Nitrospirae bacterium CG_4_9_14_3_um_filter_51_5]|nr:MAG: hypothetical protein CO149_04345 [Nitrospirae bacterium CG_4_9_14_3_um_filter_51_5]
MDHRPIKQPARRGKAFIDLAVSEQSAKDVTQSEMVRPYLPLGESDAGRSEDPIHTNRLFFSLSFHYLEA